MRVHLGARWRVQPGARARVHLGSGAPYTRVHLHDAGLFLAAVLNCPALQQTAKRPCKWSSARPVVSTCVRTIPSVAPTAKLHGRDTAHSACICMYQHEVDAWQLCVSWGLHASSGSVTWQGTASSFRWMPCGSESISIGAARTWEEAFPPRFSCWSS